MHQYVAPQNRPQKKKFNNNAPKKNGGGRGRKNEDKSKYFVKEGVPNCGHFQEKVPTSVINIMPPRELWTQAQEIKKQSFQNMFSGPHMTFVDPFILPIHYADAAPLLERALSDVEPFEITLNDIGYFQHSQSAVIVAKPSCEPPDALFNLLEKVMAVFPQCNDQITRYSSPPHSVQQFNAHMSIGRVKSEEEAKKFVEEIQKTWRPIKFILKELYFVCREGDDPFIVKEIIPFGKSAEKSLPPYFGPGATDNDPESKVARSVVVMGLPRDQFQDEDLLNWVKENGYTPIGAEMSRGLTGGGAGRVARSFGVVEFASAEETKKFLEWMEASKFSSPIFYAGNHISLIPLANTLFPDVIGGCCSLPE